MPDIQIFKYQTTYYHSSLLSFKWNLIRLGGPAHGILTKTVHKTLPGGGGGPVGG